jgi:ribosomal-protein-alanine N-acetyltransferase
LVQAPDVAALGVGSVTGFVLVRVAADEAEILTLAVVPDGRRAGRGRALMSAAEAYAVEKGALEIFLEVAEDNAPALNLYAGLGYAAVGRRPAYYPRPGAQTCDALVLAKKLVVPSFPPP